MSAVEKLLPNEEDLARSRAERVEIDASLRGPGLHFFLSAPVWLTFGRVRPAHLNSMVYGWATMGSIGMWLSLMARL